MRSAISGGVADLRREPAKLQTDLHVDAVLKLYGKLPAETSTEGLIPVGSAKNSVIVPSPAGSDPLV
jgi:hypothetical protein